MNRIFTRIFLSYLIIGLSSAMVITVIYYFIMREALIDRTYDQLSSINILKKEHLDKYFAQSKRNVEFLFTHEFFRGHLNKDGNKSLSNEGRATDLDDQVRAIAELYDFKAIAILDANLNVVFSTAPDQTDFSGIVRNAGVTGQGEPFQIIDLSTMEPRQESALLYVAQLAGEGGGRWFVVIEENFQRIQNILNETTGMGTTGESYVVGTDTKLRSTSRFFVGKRPVEISVNASSLTDSLHIINDYRDIEVVSVRRPLGSDSPPWFIYTEFDLKEAMRPVNTLRNYLIIIAILLLIVTAAVTAFVSNAISKPILYLREIIIKLSKGVIPGQKALVSNRDEVGQIADAINDLIGGLQRTTKFAYAIGEGRFDERFERLSDNDTLGNALIHMRDQIKDLNEKEVKLVREKAAALLEGQENERRRITRELHDGVGQLLTVIRFRTDGIKGQDALVGEIKALLNETSEEVKRISFNVMPSSLVDFGLKAALDGLCNQVKKLGHLEINFEYIKESDQSFAFEIVVAAYRIAQEALNNILKHAGATHVNLHVIEKENELYMLVEDDGKGFERQAGRGYGLRSMEERAKLLGGNVEVHTGAGKGTAIEVHIPAR
jgi:two-component system NarL family sensor kinase